MAFLLPIRRPKFTAASLASEDLRFMWRGRSINTLRDVEVNGSELPDTKPAHRAALRRVVLRDTGDPPIGKFPRVGEDGYQQR